MIARSAQWMEFALNPAAVEEREDESVAAAEPANRMTAGPEPLRLPELTRLVRTARGDNLNLWHARCGQ
ncbi:hypothetical protein [Corynebacterium sp.]|uniref:hypothetical protein n=1 Tax=Corynebacterium sp. TaxID=1720 RepID=UPI0026494897|nr:hypothetical protein [Corynebacterium sp.]MDN6738218.1 hypothetical protein [Corynebacterium sp.]